MHVCVVCIHIPVFYVNVCACVFMCESMYKCVSLRVCFSMCSCGLVYIHVCSLCVHVCVGRGTVCQVLSAFCLSSGTSDSSASGVHIYPSLPEDKEGSAGCSQIWS